MEQHIIDTIHSLRSKLHNLAERSGEEKRTKACLMEFLRDNTSLSIEDEGQWFYAIHKETEAVETIAFRADMDAVPFRDSAAHLCGHDGHSAVLAGLGLLLENKKLGRNVILIFQHAEENGMGGKICCKVLKRYQVDRIYTFHNIPRWVEGSILLRHDTFACASRGMTLSFIGKPSHAAHPENGRNPGFAAGRFISNLPGLAKRSSYKGLTMATLIGAKIGEKAFGSAAGSAEIWLTMRAWNEDDLNLLILSIEESALAETSCDGVEVSWSFCDIFPATVNDNTTLERLEKICCEVGLNCIEVPEPFRWSEDFGYYGLNA